MADIYKGSLLYFYDQYDQYDLFYSLYLRFKNKEQRLMFTLNCKGRLLVVDKPLVMGILNLTPDSFYPDSRYRSTDAVLKKAGQMINDGAEILDIGGQSTRPGSTLISVEEELKRVIEPIRAVEKNFPNLIISIDTFHARVAREAINAGASIINDISAGGLDEEMISTAASCNVPYVLMHMQGTPHTMQQDPVYADVTKEVLDFFIQRLDLVRKAGIRDVVIDPGFGFGKTISHNFQLLRDLSVFKMLNCPILLGISRKSTIYKTLNVPVEGSLNGTTVLNTIGLLNGANILRVHDVKEAVEVVRLFHAYSNK